MTSRGTVTVGVITATCDRLHLLKEALRSLEAQTYEHWLAAVVDDSTTSETYDWWTGNDHDPRIMYVRNDRNRGVGYSRNRALQLLLPKTEFVTKLDDDDVMHVSSLEMAAAAFRANPHDRWFMSRHVQAGSGKSITRLREARSVYQYWQDIGAGSNVMGDRTFFIASELIKAVDAQFVEDVPLGGEWRFYAQLSVHAPIRFFEGGETSGEYLPDGLSSGQSGDLKFLKSETIAKLEFGRMLDLSPEERRAAEQYLIPVVFRVVRGDVRNGRLRDGLAVMRKLDYRVALVSRAFYSGCRSVIAAIVDERADSGRAGPIERHVLGTGRRLLRSMVQCVRSR